MNIPSVFATAGEDCKVSIFRYKSEEKKIQFLSSLEGPKKTIQSVSVSSDATLVAAGCKSGR